MLLGREPGGIGTDTVLRNGNDLVLEFLLLRRRQEAERDDDIVGVIHLVGSAHDREFSGIALVEVAEPRHELRRCRFLKCLVFRDERVQDSRQTLFRRPGLW